MIVALALASAGPSFAQSPPPDTPAAVDMVKLTTADAMASHEPMPDMPTPTGRKPTPAERMKRHEAMMRRDALKAAAIKSAMPP